MKTTLFSLLLMVASASAAAGVVHFDDLPGADGSPIAHGYLTLSLLVPLVAQVLTITDVKMGVNYGLNKVRFPAPVPVGSRIRLTATLNDVQEVAGGLQLTIGAVIEREGGEKPVCIAELLFRTYGS